MSLDAGRYQLYSSFKTLRARWEQTVLLWQDTVKQDFEEQFWNLLEDRMRTSLAAIDRLGPIMARAHNECR